VAFFPLASVHLGENTIEPRRQEITNELSVPALIRDTIEAQELDRLVLITIVVLGESKETFPKELAGVVRRRVQGDPE